MPPDQTTLPSYAKPPIIEVVCGVQFNPLPKFQAAHFGQFWERIRGDYSQTEDRGPLAEIFENGQETEVHRLIASSAEAPPLPRVFFVDTKGNYLVQLQVSRLLSNWRKVRDGDGYPRFDAAYTRFQSAWQELKGFANDSGLQQPDTNQYELTYINHVLAADGESFPFAAPTYLSVLAWDGFEPDVAALKLRLPMERGALHITINHGKRSKDERDVLILDLTARGPAAADGADMADWFKEAHAMIVNTFDRISTAHAHEIWEKQ